jgi:hypothetical protein
MRCVALARCVAFVLPLALLALGACSSSTAGPSCVDYAPPAGFDALSPKVSFANDVAPIFKQSCAFSTCHGATTGTANGVFLGSDSARVRTGLLSEQPSELPSMPFVTPGDPRQSYLMRKMDASQCALDAQCTDGSCQGSMPKDQDSLPVETRDVVRRWIAQGAQDN